MHSPDFKKLARALAKNKYVLLVLALGLTLLLLPRGAARTAGAESGSAASAWSTGPPAEKGDVLAASGIPYATEAERLGRLLSGVRGVGADTEVLLSKTGAVVVCAGAEDPQARLEITGVITAYTGLGSDRIMIVRKG